MERALPFVGMVVVQFSTVASLVVGKKAIATGMTNFAFVFYSNALSSLILLPCSFLVHRSNRPPLNLSILCGLLLVGILGFLVQIFGYAGITYAPATLASAMLNLIPGFTFVLAIIFRMEKADYGSLSTQVKAIGTLLSILGAIVMTLYKGPAIFTAILNQTSPHNLFGQPSDWIIGGLILAINCVFTSLFIIVQALVLRRYPAELTVMFVYCSVVAILSAFVSLIIDGDLSKFSLEPNTRLFAVLYSGVLGTGFQVTIGAWCVHKKGPLFVSLFHPVGIVISVIMGAIFFGDGFYLGSLVGSIVIVMGFYCVMWGKATEEKVVIEEAIHAAGTPNLNSEKAVPLLQDDSVDQEGDNVGVSV